jgi:hypothetical protein
MLLMVPWDLSPAAVFLSMQVGRMKHVRICSVSAMFLPNKKTINDIDDL